MAKAKIKIIFRDGNEREVEAEIVGDLALHRWHKTEVQWTVTHVPTQLSIRDAVPENLRTGSRGAMLAWMRKVQSELKDDWTFMRELTRADVVTDPNASGLVRDRIRAHCLATRG